jgi:chloride channel 3/4/5
VGILAAAIDIVSDWLGDLKEGFCKPTFYLNRGFCCWGISGSLLTKNLRLMGRTRILLRLEYLGYGVKCHLKSWWICCFLYILYFFRGRPLFELKMLMKIVFGGAASLLVVSYAPYAKHSGIPEIKTMLGGFVIRRFIGTWVLLIKSLGLVFLLH